MSTKMRNLVKFSKVPIYLEVFSDDVIIFEKMSDPDRTKVVHLFLKPNSTEMSTNIPFEPSVRRKSMFQCEKNLDGYRRIMDDFVDIFVVTPVDFDMRSVPSDICIQYLEYAMSLGLKFKKVQVVISRGNVDCSRKVLAACAQATQLHIQLDRYSKDFFLLDKFRDYKMDVFELTINPNFEWFTLDHLLALTNCSNVRIHTVILSDADLNTFLKYWMSTIGAMETLHVELHDRGLIDGEAVMDGIPRKEIERNEKFEVERADGVKATICCDNLKFSIDLEKHSD
ncbi:hypothetical protein CAEBREN_06516 [Caenorhabditis brenneri]|uniref:Sdz-33 F-box domain-containing protein n=1 Tax=Caenorhabditis brenneri TaxID=135651 RepID=G0MQG5_CAEBE|nr:hypothetical protein CAEBREN_06516 [Caenorhabditis brenneri]